MSTPQQPPAPQPKPPTTPSSVSRPRQDRRAESIRSEALGLAVQYASGPNTFGTRDAVITTAQAFYDFLAGDVEAGK